MLNINIYANYKVHYKCKYFYISQEDSTPDDKTFKGGYVEEFLIKNGGELINILTKNIQNSYFSELNIKDNTIIIEHFNYNSGENDTCIYKIEEVKQC